MNLIFAFALLSITILPTSECFLIIPKCFFTSGAHLAELWNLVTGVDISQSSRCFVKCIGEESGFIENGELRMNNFESIPLVTTLTNQVYENAKKCLENIPDYVKIETCNDIEVFNDCFKVLDKK